MTTTHSATRTHGRRWLALLGFGAAVVVAAGIGVLGVSDTSGEYASLRQPAWAPPSWLFGPVWSLLYAMIAVSGWLVWRRVGFGPALGAWTAQLVLNAAWTPIFFGAGRYGLAFLDIVVLWLLIGLTVALFRRVSRPATLLMLPYWAWVTFAACLNLAIWQLN
ncbi:tryptophan-rich sensory protein [Micromonospora echinospora]|uniref:TspO and MBR related proteins n=1 Tax=Micromonospora echinospora TaxID=1877 RepID=A0A1C4XSB6_MICEC|nr:TspO/MBR family protein [Micromonospora echinospora]OZV78479.1 tryptophan-rich sensory protein [Micromonospora echinospora]SCF11365.1 TspO and MBR related proteins [Micromonospora echinospora]